MSGDVVDQPFAEAARKVEEAHQEAVEALRTKVAKAKSDALEKVSP